MPSPLHHLRSERMCLRGGSDRQAETASLNATEVARQRELRKKAKQEEKAQKKLMKQMDKNESEAHRFPTDIPMFCDNQPCPELFGEMEMVKSQSACTRRYLSSSELDGLPEGESFWIRARVQQSRVKGNTVFLVLRLQGVTVQAALFKSDSVTKDMIRFCGSIPRESVVDVQGGKVAATVTSCKVTTYEVHVQRIYCVSRAAPALPLLLEDAARPSEARDNVSVEQRADADSEQREVVVNLETRLNERVLDLRSPSHNSIMRIQSHVGQAFRNFLAARGFVEIHTPKLQGGSSCEGGAAVFPLDYFGSKAWLAQSPQLHKQMAVMSGFERVMEVGPVFRAESSHTSRHLCEFVGLDFEMEISESYAEAMDIVEGFVVTLLEELYHSQPLSSHVDEVAKQYPCKRLRCRRAGDNLRLSYKEAVDLLNDRGCTNEDGSKIRHDQDLSTQLERLLGEIVAEKHETDFFFITDFPSGVRPFYSMPSSSDPSSSNSFDAYLRGQEICSGAQRIHDSSLLVESLKSRGIDPSSMQPYINSFKYGGSPHAGAGLGLERLTMTILGLDNIRLASMFPRDPKRLSP